MRIKDLEGCLDAGAVLPLISNDELVCLLALQVIAAVLHACMVSVLKWHSCSTLALMFRVAKHSTVHAAHDHGSSLLSRASTAASNFMRMVVLGFGWPFTGTKWAVTLHHKQHIFLATSSLIAALFSMCPPRSI